MSFVVQYYHARVRAEIEGWPVGILASYAHLVGLLMELGPDLRMPHSRAMGNGLFELRPRGREEETERSRAGSGGCPHADERGAAWLISSIDLSLMTMMRCSRRP